jgi:hypothetical protein
MYDTLFLRNIGMQAACGGTAKLPFVAHQLITGILQRCTTACHCTQSSKAFIR